MQFYFFTQLQFLKSKIYHLTVFCFSFVSFLVLFVFTYLHYINVFYGNHVLWIGWILTLLLLFSSLISFKSISVRFEKKGLLLVLFVGVLYWVTHLWNFQIAPWNQNGLFDDAAWDIFFAKSHIFVAPFQPAFFDEVGYISREVVFHYYITAFFKLLGYNLLVFNISLLVLGFITVLFTTLIAQKLFKNVYIVVLCAVIINFFPFHYMHIFMGHRYAIAAPLMIVSLYFLYCGFLKTSFLKVSISAFFAALCLSSSIMGKQYLFGLLITVPLVVLFDRRNISKRTVSLGIMWVIGFLYAALPLLLYITFNYSQYTNRENSLVLDLMTRYNTEGLVAFQTNGGFLYDIFFTPITYRRQFLHDFYAIPFAYFGLIIPGLLIAAYKKRFELVLLAVIPVAGSFISGAYDFRILLAVPIWVLCMSFTLNSVFVPFTQKSISKKQSKITLLVVFIACVGVGLFSSVTYIWKVSKDSHYIYLLPHKDVSVSRLIQDIVAGEENPSIHMKWNEFNRREVNSKYETLVSPDSAYAIMHVYLQDFDDKKVLSFINQGIQQLKTPEEIFYDNIEAIRIHDIYGKDLKLVWEVSDKSKNTIDVFKKYEMYGGGKVISNTSEGKQFSVYILTIDKENIQKFQDEISQNALQATN